VTNSSDGGKGRKQSDAKNVSGVMVDGDGLSWGSGYEWSVRPIVSKWWLVHCDAYSVPISLARYWARLGSAEAENGVSKERV
jgi:hypothetical protein